MPTSPTDPDNVRRKPDDKFGDDLKAVRDGTRKKALGARCDLDLVPSPEENYLRASWSRWEAVASLRCSRPFRQASQPTRSGILSSACPPGDPSTPSSRSNGLPSIFFHCFFWPSVSRASSLPSWSLRIFMIFRRISFGSPPDWASLI